LKEISVKPAYQQRTAVEIAGALLAEIQALPVQNTPNTRSVRRKYSEDLKNSTGGFILNLAREILKTPGYRSVAYELIQFHKEAFQSLTEEIVEELGQGINSWWTVDSFGRKISGPAWLAGLISNEMIHGWAESQDHWWRRAALVSTVALNIRSQGGYGDTERTLAVCRKLVDDHEDMVVKGLSWALRDLVPHDPNAVAGFLLEYQGVLAARVKREVGNKIRTGLKNP
jgi:3-methyladenine DNA glycosylase AlkD